MTTTIEKSIDVDVPVDTAYNQWTQFESFPEFMEAVESVKQIDASHTHWAIKVGGVPREFDAEITEQKPDDRIAWKSTDGESHAGVVTFHKLSDDKTRIMLQMDWKPKGIVETTGSLLGVGDNEVAHDLKKFKELIEANGFEEGAWRGEIAGT